MAKGSIAYQASSKIHDVISGIGRTEDIKLSPDNKRLAVLDFLGNRIFLFSIRIEYNSASPKIFILEHSIISSSSLRYPHGVAFLGNDLIAVCNRSADVTIFAVPSAASGRHRFDLKPLRSINGKGFLLAKLKSPGSVASRALAEDSYHILVCNNYWHCVTAHTIQVRDSIRVKNNGVLIENALKIPDGISVSADGRWIAISNHVYGEVLIYGNTPRLDRNSPPVASLRGIVCPHGTRFDSSGNRVFVADAASQYLHVFQTSRGEWSGTYEPSRSVRLLDDDSFYAGRYAAREGGTKGIDIDNANKVLITSRMREAVAFYDLHQILSEPSHVSKYEHIELCRQRDQSLQRHQKDVLEQRWNLRTRVVRLLHRLKLVVQYGEKARRLIRLCRLYLRNRWTRASILDTSGPVVSMTTHGDRVKLAYFAIESIGLGSHKPSRFVLWLEDERICRTPPETLRRLQSRGLEIFYSEGLGPHTKYYPYLDMENEFTIPLVTADDDVLYPRDWLEKLTRSYAKNPAVVHCHRAHSMHLNGKRVMPYNEWTPCLSRSPSHLNFVTGVCGAIYPPVFLKYLKQQGKGFQRCCPTADDIWITVNALRAGIKIAQVDDAPAQFPAIPGSQKVALMASNVVGGGNQYQLMQTYSEADIAALNSHLASDRM